MAGYFVYAFCALGLAGFVPRPRGGGHGWLGVRLFTGFSLIPVFLFLVHIIAGVGLLAASYALVVLSALGLVRLVAGWVRVPDARPPLLHPAFVIFAAAGGVIAVHGGLAYIPYSGDEFTNWIGAAKQIFAGGGFDRARPALIHPDYPMGWPLTMVLPAVLVGRFDEGLAAAAPLVMHLALFPCCSTSSAKPWSTAWRCRRSAPACSAGWSYWPCCWPRRRAGCGPSAC